MVECGDAVGTAGRAWGQAGVEEGIVGSVDKGNHGVPALVVEPYLGWGQGRGVKTMGSALPLPATCPLPRFHLEAVLRVQTMSPLCEVVEDTVERPTRLGAQQHTQLLQ